MLHVQEWLKKYGGNFELLEKQLAISANFHPTDERVILNYSQIESPKNNPIVKECRGLVLNRYTYEVIAMAFTRFFNLDENGGHQEFVWEGCTCQEKVDGSLILVYVYNGQICVNTRNSFGEGEINDSGKTWREVVLSCLPSSLNTRDIGTHTTFVFELCSPYNKVVKQYSTCLYLLAMVFNPVQLEYSTNVRDNLAKSFNVKVPRFYKVNSREALTELIQRLESNDKTDEGVILQDVNGLRVKMKTSTYLALHRLANNGNIASYKNILPLVMTGEIDEVFAYFPEIKERALEVAEYVNYWKKDVDETYNVFRDMVTQKEFAMAVKDYEYASVLFQARKTGEEASTIFLQSESLILNKLESKSGKNKSHNRQPA